MEKHWIKHDTSVETVGWMGRRMGGLGRLACAWGASGSGLRGLQGSELRGKLQGCLEKGTAGSTYSSRDFFSLFGA